MENKKLKNCKTIKIIFIILSIIIVAFTLTGYMITSKEGGTASLSSFESFYAYIITICISLYMVIKNKNANIMIFLSILTYLWTGFLVEKTIVSLTDATIIIEPFFYIYLCSAIFLIISLFFNEKKTEETIQTNLQNAKNDVSDNINKNNFLFATFVLGTKGIPFNTEVLLVNNTTDNSLDLIYAIDNNHQTIKLPIQNIKRILHNTGIQMHTIPKKIESNQTKNMLLSAVVFGGNSMLQLAGNSSFNSLYEEISNNYGKVNLNSYFEITIDAIINGKEKKFIMNTNTYPEEFVKQILNKINTK